MHKNAKETEMCGKMLKSTFELAGRRYVMLDTCRSQNSKIFISTNNVIICLR